MHLKLNTDHYVPKSTVGKGQNFLGKEDMAAIQLERGDGRLT